MHSHLSNPTFYLTFWLLFLNNTWNIRFFGKERALNGTFRISAHLREQGSVGLKVICEFYIS